MLNSYASGDVFVTVMPVFVCVLAILSSQYFMTCVDTVLTLKFIYLLIFFVLINNLWLLAQLLHIRPPMCTQVVLL